MVNILKQQILNLKKGVDEALELNARGNTNKFIAGALGGGVAEAVFVGDVEQIGTFGDFIGGPTEIDRDQQMMIQQENY